MSLIIVNQNTILSNDMFFNLTQNMKKKKHMTHDTWHIHGTHDMWHITSDMQHMTCDIRHMTSDRWEMGGGESFLKILALQLLRFGREHILTIFLTKDELGIVWMNYWQRCLKNSAGYNGSVKTLYRNFTQQMFNWPDFLKFKNLLCGPVGNKHFILTGHAKK